MHTGRDTLFGSAFFVAPKAQGMVSRLVLLFPPCPGSHFFHPIFFHSWKHDRSGEGDGSSPRVLQRAAPAGEAKRRGLTRLPRSVHSPAKKWEISPAAFFSTRLRALTAWLLDSNPESRFSFLAACFLQVRARERGNRPFFALLVAEAPHYPVRNRPRKAQLIRPGSWCGSDWDQGRDWPRKH